MIDKLINDVNSVIFCLDALIRPPFPLFSAIANEVRQSVELFTIALSEKELHSGRGALRHFSPLVIKTQYPINIHPTTSNPSM